VPMLAETCRALPPPIDGAPPARLLLAPIGETVGRDGRRYALSAEEAAALAAALAADGADLPLDWEHATELLAPAGQRADAAGWLSDWRAEPAGLTAAVDWTPAGREAVANRAQRYYSPAYLVDQATRRIVGISSAGLTNKPNLRLGALNREDHGMPVPVEIRQALDLPETATPEQAATAIRALAAELNAARTATPELSRFVPRADYDAALHRATQAETALRTAQQAETNRAVDALLQQGLAEARITPATVEYHRAQAATEGGIDRLRAYLAAAPTVVGTENNRQGEPPKGAEVTTADQRAIMAAFGMTPELLDKHAGTAGGAH
jgi:phage I-like protein